MSSTVDSMAGAFGHRLAPPGDPWEGSTFDALYKGRIEPELSRCERERGRDVMIFAAGLALAALAVSIEIALFRDRLPGFLLIATVLGIGAAAYLPLSRLSKRAKTAVLEALCTPLAVTYAAAGPEPAGVADYYALKLLTKPDRGAYTDLFTGRRGKSDFSMCSALMSTGSGKERRITFRGQLIRMSTGRARSATTVVLRNSGWLNGLAKPQGLKPVGLEDIRFNKEFVVYGSDQVEAREILTPAFMQQLLDLESGFGGAHIRCAFTERDLLIALESNLRFGIGGMFSSLVQRSRVEAIARNLEQLFGVVDGFDRA